MLCRVDPRKPDHQGDDHQEKEQLDPDRDPDQPAGAPGPLTTPLAVSGVRNQRSAALVAGDLSLGHYFKGYILR